MYSTLILIIACVLTLGSVKENAVDANAQKRQLN